MDSKDLACDVNLKRMEEESLNLEKKLSETYYFTTPDYTFKKMTNKFGVKNMFDAMMDVIKQQSQETNPILNKMKIIIYLNISERTDKILASF